MSKNVWKLANFYSVFHTLITLQKPKKYSYLWLDYCIRLLELRILSLLYWNICNNGNVVHSFVISNVTHSVAIFIRLKCLFTLKAVVFSIFNAREIEFDWRKGVVVYVRGVLYAVRKKFDTMEISLIKRICSNKNVTIGW